jgi:hypothetical protein
MEFVIVTVGAFALLFLFVLVLGKWYPGSGAEVLDWKPTRSYEDEVQLELDDIDQMIEAQNERRRRTGRKEITEDEVRAEVSAAEREQERRAARYRDVGGDDLTPPA